MADLFRPISGCGPWCLAPRRTGIGSWALTILRAAVAVTILGVTAIAGVALQATPPAVRAKLARVVLRGAARSLLRALGVRLRRTGMQPPSTRALLVANHVSWLDILVVIAATNARLVAKTEVGSWPIIGRLARLCGTIFIDRESFRSLPDTVAEVRDALAGGDVVVAFPEGTTTCGAHPMAYRPAVFQAAIDAKARVVPMTLNFRRPDGGSDPNPAFIGDETLMTSISRVLETRAMRLELHVGVSLHPDDGASRKHLARVAASRTPAPIHVLAA